MIGEFFPKSELLEDTIKGSQLILKYSQIFVKKNSKGLFRRRFIAINDLESKDKNRYVELYRIYTYHVGQSFINNVDNFFVSSVNSKNMKNLQKSNILLDVFGLNFLNFKKTYNILDSYPQVDYKFLVYYFKNIIGITSFYPFLYVSASTLYNKEPLIYKVLNHCKKTDNLNKIVFFCTKH